MQPIGRRGLAPVGQIDSSSETGFCPRRHHFGRRPSVGIFQRQVAAWFSVYLNWACRSTYRTYAGKYKTYNTIPKAKRSVFFKGHDQCSWKHQLGQTPFLCERDQQSPLYRVQIFYLLGTSLKSDSKTLATEVGSAECHAVAALPLWEAAMACGVGFAAKK